MSEAVRQALGSHTRLADLEERGFVELRRFEGALDPGEWEALEYLDWHSGGETDFAVLASATGREQDPQYRKFGRPDKHGIWTASALRCPGLTRWATELGGRLGRVRVIRLAPSTYPEMLGELHRDNNNALNPEGEGWIVRVWLQLSDDPGSRMILREDRDDPATEWRIPLPAGAQFVVDSERLWHAVWHPADGPRYALLASVESGPGLGRWIESRLP
jgi:hypothetical protein